MPSKPKTPPRKLTAEQVAEITGRQRRAVLLWAKRKESPCPHDHGPKFDLKEVHAWLDARGMDRVAAARAGIKKASKKTTKKPSKPPKTRDDDLPSIEPTGDDAFDRILSDVYESLCQLQDEYELDGESTAPEWRSYATALRTLSGEYRQLLRLRAEVVEFSRAWLSADAAIRYVLSIGKLALVQLASARAGLPELAIERLLGAGLLEDAQTDEARRVLMSASADVLDESAGVVRTHINQAVEELRK